MTRQKYDDDSFAHILDEIIAEATAKAFRETIAPPITALDPYEAPNDNDWTGEFDWIRDGFENLVPPDPTQMDVPIAVLDTVENRLGRIEGSYKQPPLSSDMLSDIEYAKEAVTGWKGMAADAYEENVTTPLPVVTSNNCVLAAALKSAYKRSRNIYAIARDDLMSLAVATRDSLKDLYEKEGGESISVFGMTSALTTVVAGLATFAGGKGAAPAAIFTTLAGASSAAGEFSKPSGTYKHPVMGDSVNGILTSMRTGQETFVAELEDTEKRLAECLREYLSVSYQHSAPGEGMVVKAPSALTDPPEPGKDRGDDFAPDTLPAR